jgi:hypothetical protein
LHLIFHFILFKLNVKCTKITGLTWRRTDKPNHYFHKINEQKWIETGFEDGHENEFDEISHDDAKHVVLKDQRRNMFFKLTPQALYYLSNSQDWSKLTLIHHGYWSSKDLSFLYESMLVKKKTKYTKLLFP